MNAESKESLSSPATARTILEEATKSGFSTRFMLAEGIEKYPIPTFVELNRCAVI